MTKKFKLVSNMYKINFQKKAKNIDNCRIIHKGVLLKREKMKWRNKCMKKVYGLIRRLGANSKYKGYFFRCGSGKDFHGGSV